LSWKSDAKWGETSPPTEAKVIVIATIVALLLDFFLHGQLK
jgi:hypothetical protein